MSARITDLIFKCIERALSRRSHHRVGIVSSYDPKTHSAKFMRQPENIETGFLPVGMQHVGNGWGMAIGPQVGDQFVLGFINGDIEVPFVVCRLASDQETPPMAKSGEVVLVHQKGSKFSMNADGSVTHTSNQGLSMTAGKALSLTGNNGVTITASGSGNLA